MIKKFNLFEKSSYERIEIGDYVKFKPISGFYSDKIVGDAIFEIVDEEIKDNDRTLTIKTVIGKYKLHDISSYTVRHITDEEREIFEIKLNTKKYNI